MAEQLRWWPDAARHGAVDGRRDPMLVPDARDRDSRLGLAPAGLIGDLLTWLRRWLPEGTPLPLDVWRQRHAWIVGLLWLHVAWVFLFGVFLGSEPVRFAIDVPPIAVAAALAAWTDRGRTFRTVAASLGLVLSSAALVHLSGGLIEMHFHYFVVVGLIALYQDWRAYLTAVAFVLVEHGVVGVLDPAAVYDHGGAHDQPWRWALVHTGFFLTASLIGMVGWRLNESARRQAERIFLAVGDGIVVVDVHGRISSVNPAAETALGWGAGDLLGRPFDTILAPAEAAGDAADTVANPIADTLRDGPGGAHRDARFRRRDATAFAVEYSVTPFREHGALTGAVVAFRDISARRALERELQSLAFKDPLTGLPNRVLLRDRLKHALARAKRRGTNVALLFLDLDNFKIVNDSLGHHVGDALLTEVANRIARFVRPEDTIARLGGDEFTVLLEDIHQPTDVLPIAQRLSSELARPFVAADHEVVVTASIGVALGTAHLDHPDNLLRDADLAMYRAKADGKARFAVFDPAMNDEAMERLALEADLRRAVDRGELRIYYQPVVRLDDATVTEVEALVRWQHPERGLVAPGTFIPLAEETGLIVPIGDWVLRAACKQLADWQRRYPERAPRTISVNLSSRQFQNPNLVRDVARALGDAPLPPDRLKLEITESVMMHEADSTVRTLRELKALGVQLAVDDFGTGYSSLAYLKRFPIDVVKVDRSFVKRLGHDPEDSAIVRSIVALARALSLDVTGEGIETDEQLVHLRDLGCDFGQGYYFGRPLPAEVVTDVLDGAAPHA